MPKQNKSINLQIDQNLDLLEDLMMVSKNDVLAAIEELKQVTALEKTKDSSLEFPTIPLLRKRIQEYRDSTGCSLRHVARRAGVSYRALTDICSRRPGYNRTQKLEFLLPLVDGLNRAGVNISRLDVCSAILAYQPEQEKFAS